MPVHFPLILTRNNQQNRLPQWKSYRNSLPKTWYFHGTAALEAVPGCLYACPTARNTFTRECCSMELLSNTTEAENSHDYTKAYEADYRSRYSRIRVTTREAG